MAAGQLYFLFVFLIPAAEMQVWWKQKGLAFVAHCGTALKAHFSSGAPRALQPDSLSPIPLLIQRAHPKGTP